jgi:hypothetical protein
MISGGKPMMVIIPVANEVVQPPIETATPSLNVTFDRKLYPMSPVLAVGVAGQRDADQRAGVLDDEQCGVDQAHAVGRGQRGLTAFRVTAQARPLATMAGPFHSCSVDASTPAGSPHGRAAAAWDLGRPWGRPCDRLVPADQVRQDDPLTVHRPARRLPFRIFPFSVRIGEEWLRQRACSRIRQPVP